MLLGDCLRLWGLTARLEPSGDGIAVSALRGRFVLCPAAKADRPVRWHLTWPSGRSRALPSIVAALSTLRYAISQE